jgi:hypothetical protein
LPEACKGVPSAISLPFSTETICPSCAEVVGKELRPAICANRKVGERAKLANTEKRDNFIISLLSEMMKFLMALSKPWGWPRNSISEKKISYDLPGRFVDAGRPSTYEKFCTTVTAKIVLS